MPPFTTNTICYDPLINVATSTSTSTAIPTVYTTSGPTISFTYEDTEEKMKEYCDKVDQHVDKLEEDIEFLNERRTANEAQIEFLVQQNIEKDTKIKELTLELHDIKGYANYLVSRIDLLEAQINENNT